MNRFTRNALPLCLLFISARADVTPIPHRLAQESICASTPELNALHSIMQTIIEGESISPASLVDLHQIALKNSESCNDPELQRYYRDLIIELEQALDLSTEQSNESRGGILSVYPSLLAAIVTIRSHLYCNAPAQFTDTVRVTGETIVNGEVTVSGPLTISSNQDSVIGKNLVVDGNLTVGGLLNATVSGTVTTTVNFTGPLSGDVTGTQSSTVLSKVGSLAGSAGVVHNNSSGVLSSSLIVNSDVASAAGISYSKLNLTNSIVNADINTSAGIAYSKLNLTNSIVNADVNSAANIAYSKLNLSNSIVNADINASAAIAYSKLNLTNSIVNADINASAAIADTKLATISTAGKVANSATTATSTDTANTIVLRDVSGNFSANTITIDGNLNIPTTTSSSVGCISQTPSGLPLIHTYNNNTAMGFSALNFSTTGTNNVALGNGALTSLTGGSANVALGGSALTALNDPSINSFNVAVGHLALTTCTAAANNTAVGYQAGRNLTSGQGNTMIGLTAGSALTSGNNNVYIDNDGVASESSTIRIGRTGVGGQTRFFGTGIYGVTTGSATTLPVLVDVNGQLGTAASSRRFKENIERLDESMLSKLAQLEPVKFNYRHDATHGIEYGLIAEQVAEVMPELIAHDADGQIYSVKYQMLPALLLHACQQQEKTLQKLESQLAELKARIS